MLTHWVLFPFKYPEVLCGNVFHINPNREESSLWMSPSMQEAHYSLWQPTQHNRHWTVNIDQMLLLIIRWNLPFHNPLCLKFKTLEQLCPTELSAIIKYSISAQFSSHWALGMWPLWWENWILSYFILFEIATCGQQLQYWITYLKAFQSKLISSTWQLHIYVY